MPPSSVPRLCFSTEMLPERDRFSAFREDFARRVLAMDVIDHTAGRPRIDITFMPLGSVAVGTLAATPAEFTRREHHLKDGSDDFRLDLIQTGPVQFAHARRENVCDAGWAHFGHEARPMRGFGPRDGRIMNVTVRAAALRTLVAHPEDLAGYAVRPGSALRLLDGYLRSLTSLEEPPSIELASIVDVHLLDLVAAVLGPTAEAREVGARRGLKAARLHAIQAEIARRFADSAFDLDRLSSAVGLSRRYVQQLLEETGKSFTEHLVECRLQRAHSLLTDRRSLHLGIIDIAFAAGFGDVSHFNRVFRRRFGDTPSAVRATAMRQQRT